MIPYHGERNRSILYIKRLLPLTIRYYWILGGGICLIIIVFCLFPLWPKKIRKGAGWLSWSAVVFLVVVLVVGIIKYILFALLYLFSAKKLRSKRID